MSCWLFHSPANILATLGVPHAAACALARRHAVRRNTELNSIMAQALDMDEYYVLEYDVILGYVKNIHGNLLPKRGISIEELVERIAPEERKEFRELIDSMKRGDCDSWTLQRRYNTGTSEEPCWRTFVGGAVVERENSVPRYIVHTVKDITHDLEEEQRDQELADKYMKVFETNMMAMSFHDANGYLINMNQRMRDLLEITEERERHFRQVSFLEDPFLKGYVNQGHFETFHVCGRMLYQDWGIDKYIETRIVPVKDDTGCLVYYIITSRDVTAERDMYMKQREHERHLKETHDAINRFEKQLRYLLEESYMYVWTFNQYERIIRFTRSLRQTEYSVTLEDYMAGMDENQRPEAERIFREQVLNGDAFCFFYFYGARPWFSPPYRAELRRLDVDRMRNRAIIFYYFYGHRV